MTCRQKPVDCRTRRCRTRGVKEKEETKISVVGKLKNQLKILEVEYSCNAISKRWSTKHSLFVRVATRCHSDSHAKASFDTLKIQDFERHTRIHIHKQCIQAVSKGLCVLLFRKRLL